MSNIVINTIKDWAKNSFKDYEPTPRGFCIPFITVIVNGSTMEVCNFDRSGDWPNRIS